MYWCIIVITYSNKMQILWKRIKTEQSTQYLPFNQFYNLSQRSGSKMDAVKRSLIGTKLMTQRTQQKLTSKDRGIKEENVRLIYKLMEIGCRKSKIKSQEPLSLPKKREYSERERQIASENQRLGRSLVRIKSGKSVERVKTDIAKSLAKLNKKKKKTLQSNRLLTAQANDPQTESPHRNLMELSKCQNLPKKLTRARLMGPAQILQFKKNFM